MSIIKTSNTEYIMIIINKIIKLFPFNSISYFSDKKITTSIMMFLTNLTFIKWLFCFTIYIDMTKTITSKTYILLWTDLCFMTSWKTIETYTILGTYCFIMSYFIAFKTNDIIFKISKIIIIFKMIRRCIIYLLSIFLWTWSSSIMIIILYLILFRWIKFFHLL
jgi:hypothetical protein